VQTLTIQTIPAILTLGLGTDCMQDDGLTRIAINKFHLVDGLVQKTKIAII
jgi:hypothetical protein